MLYICYADLYTLASELGRHAFLSTFLTNENAARCETQPHELQTTVYIFALRQLCFESVSRMNYVFCEGHFNNEFLRDEPKSVCDGFKRREI